MKKPLEKVIEKAFCDAAKKKGGIAIKMPAIHLNGLPDRLCLLPGGILFFCELKAPGKKPRKLQLSIHRKLKKLGFKVEIIDSIEKVHKILDQYD